MRAFATSAVTSLALAVTSLALASFASPLQADPTVVVVQTRGAPALPSLSSQLGVHAPTATVELRSESDADPLTFAARASELAGDRDAIVVWIAPVDHGYLVFAAGRTPDRALTELVRVDASIDPTELARTIALKVAGLLDVRAVLAAPIDGARIDGADPRVRGARFVEGGAPVVDGRAHAWAIEVSGGFARDAHERSGDPRAQLAIGHGWRLESPALDGAGWIATASVAVHWQPSGTIDGAMGRASVTELAIGLVPELARVFASGRASSTRAALARGSIAVFARPRLVLAGLFARGQSDDGRVGDATILAPSFGLELGARYSLSASAAVGITIGGEAFGFRHELLVDEEVVIDVGRFRLTSVLALTVAI